MVDVVDNRAPGVRLQVVASLPAPVLDTGVPVFVGLWRREPPAALTDLARALGIGDGFLPPYGPVSLNAATWTSLDAVFGNTWAGGMLGPALRGFFANGGRRCHVLLHGQGGLGEALQKLEAFEDFDLVCAPDSAGNTQDHVAILGLCGRRPGCFALLDGVGSSVPNPALNADSFITGAQAIQQNASPALCINAALLGPWLKVRRACSTCNGTGCPTCGGTGDAFVPPSGHIAGIASRFDQKIGPHRAPANEPLEGVLDVQVAFGDSSLSGLNGRGVIPIRALPGRGIRAWGARTLAPNDGNFSHVNVRRTYLTILRFLEFVAADLAFELNEFRLWLRVQREVSAFLEELRVAGAFYGESATEAYYVKCDEETNPPELRENGIVAAEIGVSIAKPNEFIIVRLMTGASGIAGTGG
ncbi:MAG TPA: phage tail sheath subtilisin-like domain-containing protein [Polyangium sp.]|nr:phage tail sheath subtilisin-like domain-containing protein [Polyangium sp.]